MTLALWDDQGLIRELTPEEEEELFPGWTNGYVWVADLKGKKVAAHLPGQHDQKKHGLPYKSIDKMSRKDMLQELSEVHAYTGPTSYTKPKLSSIVLEQRKKTDAALAKEKMALNEAAAAGDLLPPPTITNEKALDQYKKGILTSKEYYAITEYNNGTITHSEYSKAMGGKSKSNIDVDQLNNETAADMLAAGGPWTQSATFQQMSADEQLEYVKYYHAGGTAYPYAWKQGKASGSTSSSGVVKPKIDPPPASKSVGPGRGKRFDKYGQADDYGKEVWGNHRDNTSKADKQAIGHYIATSSQLNGSYRKSQPLPEHALKTRNALDTFIETGPRAPDDILAYRGFSGHSHILEQPVGTRFLDNGFTSVSLHDSIGYSFSGTGQGQFKNSRVVAEIKIPKGAKMGYISNINGYQHNEAEAVLPRGSQFKIVGSRPDKIQGYNVTIVELELES